MTAPVPASASFEGLPTGPREDALAVAGLLTGRGRLGVAYSGGVDSAVLLAVAVRALGRDHAIGLLAVSESLPERERRAANQTAVELGADLVEFATHEGEVPEYRANGVDRCYHCKDELFTVIDHHLIASLGLGAVAYGENADDARREDRPGSRAARDHEILHPLADAGVTKARVRALARALGLSVADKPAAPCLASRIPHGEEVTPEKLRQIEQAEDVLHELGVPDCRVRHHGDIARIEVPAHEIARLSEGAAREALVVGVRRAGFRYVTLDLLGLQSGAFTLELMRTRG